RISAEVSADRDTEILRIDAHQKVVEASGSHAQEEDAGRVPTARADGDPIKLKAERRRTVERIAFSGTVAMNPDMDTVQRSPHAVDQDCTEFIKGYRVEFRPAADLLLCDRKIVAVPRVEQRRKAGRLVGDGLQDRSETDPDHNLVGIDAESLTVRE